MKLLFLFVAVLLAACANHQSAYKTTLRTAPSVKTVKSDISKAQASNTRASEKVVQAQGKVKRLRYYTERLNYKTMLLLEGRD